MIYYFKPPKDTAITALRFLLRADNPSGDFYLNLDFYRPPYVPTDFYDTYVQYGTLLASYRRTIKVTGTALLYYTFTLPTPLTVSSNTAYGLNLWGDLPTLRYIQPGCGAMTYGEAFYRYSGPYWYEDSARYTPNITFYERADGSVEIKSVVQPTEYAPNQVCLLAKALMPTAKDKVEFFVSRNNGSTWTQVQPDVLTDISGQPVGNQLVAKAVIHNDAELVGWGLAWK